MPAPRSSSLPRRIAVAVSAGGLSVLVAGAALTGGAAVPRTAAAGTTQVAPRVEVLAPRSSALLAATTLAAPRAAARNTGVNPSSITSVNAAYWARWAPALSVPTGWTGSTADCTAGSTSAASRAATLAAINYARELNRLAPVRFSTSLDSQAQYAALLMSANGALSHAPPRSWRCYTAVGARTAGKSNLALAYPELTSGELVRLYLDDPGAGNYAAGHRRWLMYPKTAVMGSGSTRTANALVVFGATNAHNPNPAWTSWPSAGYFPSTLEPGRRWSLSAGNAKVRFAKASVRVYRNGVRVRAAKLRVVNGYGKPTLVWTMRTAATSGVYKVVVKGIRIGSSKKKHSHTYLVRMFTPHH